MAMLIILDKDGTLVEPASGSDFAQHYADQKLIPGVAERIAELKAMGATLVIASNQGGVAAGHKSLESAIAEVKFACELAGIETAFFCPDFQGQTCIHLRYRWDSWSDPDTYSPSDFANSGVLIENFRKPGAGMLQAAQLFRESEALSDVDATMIGDSEDDRNAAANAGIAFVNAEAWRNGTVSILAGRAFIA
jgi:D-glycero-D-manno-heptose 1,7-bisphosphate phosphatase